MPDRAVVAPVLVLANRSNEPVTDRASSPLTDMRWGSSLKVMPGILAACSCSATPASTWRAMTE